MFHTLYTLLLTAFTFTTLLASPPVGDDGDENAVYSVSRRSVKLRTAPTTKAATVAVLQQNELLRYIDQYDEHWWFVEHEGHTGFIYRRAVAKIPDLTQEDLMDWSTVEMSTTEYADCGETENVYDLDYQASLTINGSGDRDALLKLIDVNTNATVRTVYVAKEETIILPHIPEGVYKLHIAYGNNLMQKEIDGRCVFRFTDRVFYDVGSFRFDFFRTGTHERVVTKDGKQTIETSYNVPTYTITLAEQYNYTPDASGVVNFMNF